MSALSPLERTRKLILAKQDPGYFLHDPYFVPWQEGEDPYPFQHDLFVEFYGERLSPQFPIKATTGNTFSKWKGYKYDLHGEADPYTKDKRYSEQVPNRFMQPTHPKNYYKELYIAGGMGGSKTKTTSIFLARDLFDLLIRENPAKDYNLASHSHIFILCVAKSDEQAADTLFAELSVLIKNSPFFQEYKPRIRPEQITFDAHPDVEVLVASAASAGSVVGRNVKAVGFDEIDSYDETQSQRGVQSVYSRLRKSTNRFGFNGHVFAISSPWHQNSQIMNLIRMAEVTPRTLARLAPTWEMNPTKAFDSEEMQAELARDPVTFWRDYGVQPHNSQAAYYPDSSVVNINTERVNVLEYNPDIMYRPPELVNGFQRVKLSSSDFPNLRTLDMTKNYIFAIDPGRVSDSFGFSLLHEERSGSKKRIIADGIGRFIPKLGPLNPLFIKSFLLYIIDTVPIRCLVTDQVWFYTEAMDEIQRKRVPILSKPNTKAEHDAVRNAWYEDTFELCNYPYIRTEFENLVEIDSKRIGQLKSGKIDVVDAITRGYWAFSQVLPGTVYPNIIVVI